MREATMNTPGQIIQARSRARDQHKIQSNKQAKLKPYHVSHQTVEYRVWIFTYHPLCIPIDILTTKQTEGWCWQHLIHVYRDPTMESGKGCRFMGLTLTRHNTFLQYPISLSGSTDTQHMNNNHHAEALWEQLTFTGVVTEFLHSGQS